MPIVNIVEDFSDDVYAFTFTQGAEYPWVRMESVTEEGLYYIRSTNAGIGRSVSDITFNIEVPEGAENARVEVDYIADCESRWDYLAIAVNGVEELTASGGERGTFLTALSPGISGLSFAYSKDGAINRLTDTAYVSSIRLYYESSADAEPEPRIETGESALRGAGRLSARGERVRRSSGSIEAHGVLTSEGDRIGSSTAILLGQGAIAFTSSGQEVSRSSDVDLKSRGHLTAEGLRGAEADTHLQGAGTTTLEPEVIRRSYAELEGSGILLADAGGVDIHTSTAELLGHGRTTAAPTVDRTARIELEGSTSLTSEGVRMRSTTVDVRGQGTLNAETAVTWSAQADLKGRGSLESSAGGVNIHTADAALLGKGEQTAQPRRETEATARVSGGATMTSTSLRETVGSTHVTGAGILAAKTGGVNVRTGSADLYGTGTGTSEGGLTLLSAVRLEGGAAVAVVGVRDFHTKSQVVGYGTLVASGGRMVTASAQLVGSGLLAVTEGEPVIGVTYLEARQELYVQVQAGRRLFEDLQARQGSHAQLEAQQALYVQLVAAYALYTQLGGSIDMTKQNQDFSMYAGNSKFIRFRVDGAQDLTGASFRWIVRGSGGTEAVLDKTSGDGITVEGGEAQIKLTPADTKNLVGRYYHECAMTDESGNVSTIFIGNVTFNKSYI